MLALLPACASSHAAQAVAPTESPAGPAQSVSLANLPPLVSGGPDQEVLRGTTVTLDGRASFHPLYHPLTDSVQVRWSQLSGNQAVALSNPTDLLTSFVAPPDEDTLTFQLLLSAANGRQATQNVVVHVVSGDPQVAPVVAVDGDRSIAVGAGFSLTATVVDSPSPAAASPTLTWQQNAGEQTAVTTNAAQLTGTGGGTGVLVFSARATGVDGLASAPNYAIIVVGDAANTGIGADAPTTTAVPPDDITAAPNTQVTLASSTAAYVQLSGEPVTLFSGSAAQPCSTLCFLAPDDLATLVFASYAASESLRSAPELFTVDVADPALAALSASAGPDRLSHPGSTVVLDGQLSVAGNAAPQWTQPLGPQVTLNDANSLTPSFLAPSESSELSFALRLMLADANQQATYTAPSTVVVRVRPVTLNDPPTIALAQAAIDTTHETLTATVTDPEGDAIASTHWAIDATSASSTGVFATPNALVTIFTSGGGARPIVVSFKACDALGACATQTLALTQ